MLCEALVSYRAHKSHDNRPATHFKRYSYTTEEWAEDVETRQPWQTHLCPPVDPQSSVHLNSLAIIISYLSNTIPSQKYDRSPFKTPTRRHPGIFPQALHQNLSYGQKQGWAQWRIQTGFRGFHWNPFRLLIKNSSPAIAQQAPHGRKHAAVPRLSILLASRAWRGLVQFLLFFSRKLPQKQS